MKLQDTQGYTPITQKSINNVKCTRIISGEGSDKYNKYIQYLAKKVLTISANRTDGHKNDEVGILARLDGTYESQPIYGYWNEKAGTSIINLHNNVEYNFLTCDSSDTSLVLIHNHPCNTVLSLNDIILWLCEDTILTLVAICHNGDIHYASKTSSDFSKYKNIASKIASMITKGKINADDIYSKLISRQDEFKIEIR